MAISVNKTILVGYVGQKPEIKSTSSGKKIAYFSLATSEVWEDKKIGKKSEKKIKTEWHRVVIFSEGLTKLVEMTVQKGSKLYVEGSSRTRKWLDNTKQTRLVTEVVLSSYDHRLVPLDKKETIPYSGYTMADLPSLEDE